MSFFRHLWSTKGISPDPKKIKSILEMNFPEDKETMHSFLGLVNFLNRYSPRLAELSSPLCDLIQKDAHYRIIDIHKQAFASIKSEFSAKITLPYFSKDKETLLQTDASKKGFGYRRTNQFTLHPEHSLPVKRTTRTLNANAWPLSGEWKSSTTTCMEDTSHCRLIKSL